MRNLLGLGTLLLSTAAFGQTIGQGSVVLITPLSSQNCPVGFSARHAMDGGLIAIDRSAKSPEHGYTLSFDASGVHAIAQARITLRGLAGQQFMPASGRGVADAGRGAAGVTETFTVAPAAEPNHKYRSTVYAEKLTGVQWVELNDITYADGSRWHGSATSPCRVAPNGFVLVASGR